MKIKGRLLDLPCLHPPLRPKKKKPEEKEGDNDKENGAIIIDI
jgi:hypothetical protein